MPKLGPVLESFAVQMARPDFDVSGIGALIGDLPDLVFRNVVYRAREIALKRGMRALAEADALYPLSRPGQETRCPKDEDIIPWLRRRGLVEEVDGALRFKTAGPRRTP